MSNFQNVDFATDFEQQSAASSNKTTKLDIHDDLIVMMQKHQSEIEDYFKERETKWANFFNSYRTSTIISNKERQQRHQYQDTATRIQCIARRFIQQKFIF
eukprot:15331263-Ditylum_brightwellii.AAC.1